jgi:putative redox protein
MHVEISNTDGINFKATTSKASFDVIPKEVSPIELFAVAIISCSGTDMVMLPQKQGFEVKNLTIGADIERNESYPQKFNTLHVTYTFDSTADETTARRWVLSSLETYCSTINTIRSDVKVSYSIRYNGTCIADNEKLISGEGMKLTAENAADIGGCCS